MNLLRSLTTPKQGETKNDDCGYFDSSKEGVYLLVISDGASGSIYSGDWAQELCKGFIHEYKFFEEDFVGWKDKHATQWKDDHKLADLPWYVENKFEQGSAASLHAVVISLEENGLCRSYCIGDSCLFILKSEEIIKMIPKMNASDFNNYPKLVTTNKDQLIMRMEEEFHVCDGDTLLLMTDALSKWFIQEYYDNKEERNWLRLLQIDSELEFKQFLYSELLKTRADGSPAIQNDDFSLLKYCLSKTKLAISGEGVTNGIPNCE